MSEFCGQYPDIQPDVQLSDGIGNWVLERADVGFRIGTSPDDGVIARRLFAVQLIVCAAPAYLQRHGTPLSLDELSAHRCSVFRHPTTGKVVPWYLKVGGEIVQRHVPPFLFTNDTELELQSVLSGHVIGQLANLSAAPYIRSGQLVPVLLPHISEHIGVHVYYGSRQAQPKRVRAFVDLAIARLLDTADFVLSAKELAAAHQAHRAKRKR